MKEVQMPTKPIRHAEQITVLSRLGNTGRTRNCTYSIVLSIILFSSCKPTTESFCGISINNGSSNCHVEALIPPPSTFHRVTNGKGKKSSSSSFSTKLMAPPRSTLTPTTSTLQSSAGDLNTAYEWLARQRGPPISVCINWVDPLEQTLPPPPSKLMGFDVSNPTPVEQSSTQACQCLDGDYVTNGAKMEEEEEDEESQVLRLPVYPLPAVHLPSSAVQTLYNVEPKNIQMALDLKAGRWHLPLYSSTKYTKDNQNNQMRNATKNEDGGGGYFVTTLRAHDTHRIATIGTLMQVQSLQEEYSYNGKKLIRIVVTCQAKGIVEIMGVEGKVSNGKKKKKTLLEESCKSEKEEDYWIGHVKVLELTSTPPHWNDYNDIHNTNGKTIPNGEIVDDSKFNDRNGSATTTLDPKTLQTIVNNYAAVRSLYTNPTNGIAIRELPLFARDAVQANLPPFTSEDFLSREEFWNIAECWQMLCNTVREARRSQLTMDINEIMIEAANARGGPLQLPIKRRDLPEDVQGLLNRMEQDASEDYVSCGMDPFLDFQALLGMGGVVGNRNYNRKSMNEYASWKERERKWKETHVDRILFLGNVIQKERRRLETKERLKGLFQTGGGSSGSSGSSGSGGGGGGGDESKNAKDDFFQ